MHSVEIMHDVHIYMLHVHLIMLLVDLIILHVWCGQIVVLLAASDSVRCMSATGTSCMCIHVHLPTCHMLITCTDCGRALQGHPGHATPSSSALRLPGTAGWLRSGLQRVSPGPTPGIHRPIPYQPSPCPSLSSCSVQR